MTISVNGVVMKDSLDVFKEAGCLAGHTEIFATEASRTGSLEIEFDASVENAMVSYIEVARSPDPVPTISVPISRPTMSPSPSSLPSLRPSSQPVARTNSRRGLDRRRLEG